MSAENLYTPNCIRTHSGLYFNVLDPKPEQIDIKDIAWSLSRQCRFGAHLPVWYSVAQHSVWVADEVERPFKLQALMHDASEAYLLDIPSPIKKHLIGYKEIEARVMLVIAEKFGFKWPMHDCVIGADERALQNEWDIYMLQKFTGPSWTRQYAYNTFLNRFKHFSSLA